MGLYRWVSRYTEGQGESRITVKLIETLNDEMRIQCRSLSKRLAHLVSTIIIGIKLKFPS